MKAGVFKSRNPGRCALGCSGVASQLFRYCPASTVACFWGEITAATGFIGNGVKTSALGCNRGGAMRSKGRFFRELACWNRLSRTEWRIGHRFEPWSLRCVTLGACRWNGSCAAIFTARWFLVKDFCRLHVPVANFVYTNTNIHKWIVSCYVEDIDTARVLVNYFAPTCPAVFNFNISGRCISSFLLIDISRLISFWGE